MNDFTQLSLDNRLLRAVDACGYKNPTPIQLAAIPAIMAKRDIVAVANTGTGKTAAFVLPILNNFCASEQLRSKAVRKPRVLVLAPTRELAQQITTAAHLYGKSLHLNMLTIVGGVPYYKQKHKLQGSLDIIVATPGRLLDYLRNNLLDLSSVDTLVLDEADRMLDMGFIDDVYTIVASLAKQRQTLLFSATVDGKLDQIIKQLMHNPVHINLLAQQQVTPAQIQQELYLTDGPEHKNRLLDYFVAQDNIYKAIIFTATKSDADKLAKYLRAKNYSANPLHGDLRQTVRNRTVELLRQGKLQFIVATDLAARGIDIADITHVFNYDLPKFHEDYVHRIGRTGRAGKLGVAISFALPHDVNIIKKIERYTKQQIARKIIAGLEPQVRPKTAPVRKFTKPKHGTAGGFKAPARRAEHNAKVNHGGRHSKKFTAKSRPAMVT